MEGEFAIIRKCVKHKPIESSYILNCVRNDTEDVNGKKRTPHYLRKR